MNIDRYKRSKKQRAWADFCYEEIMGRRMDRKERLERHLPRNPWDESSCD